MKQYLTLRLIRCSACEDNFFGFRVFAYASPKCPTCVSTFGSALEAIRRRNQLAQNASRQRLAALRLRKVDPISRAAVQALTAPRTTDVLSIGAQSLLLKEKLS